jgi:hypothetical protein
MTTNRITNPLRLSKLLAGAAGAVISIGLAAPASADPVTTAGASQPSQPGTPQDFLAAARAAGITGTDPAMLGDGYNVCWQLWNQHAPGTQVAAGLVRDHPQLTSDEAAHFVLAAYDARCPAHMTIGLTAPAERHLRQRSVMRRLPTSRRARPAR